MIFVPTVLRILAASLLFTGICFLKAGNWDALGMGFIKIRFRFWHLFAMGVLSLFSPGGKNWSVVGMCLALLVGALGISYVAACLLLWLIGR